MKQLKLYSRCGHMTKFQLIQHFYERRYHNKFYTDLTRKIFEGWSWVKFKNFKLVLGMTLKFCSCVEKGLKVKVRKCYGKQARNLVALPPPPILNRLKSELTDSRPVKTIKKKKYRFYCLIDCSVEVTCIVTVIILENEFGNIKSAVFTHGGIRKRKCAVDFACLQMLNISLHKIFIYLLYSRLGQSQC